MIIILIIEVINPGETTNLSKANDDKPLRMKGTLTIRSLLFGKKKQKRKQN